MKTIKQLHKGEGFEVLEIEDQNEYIQVLQFVMKYDDGYEIPLVTLTQEVGKVIKPARLTVERVNNDTDFEIADTISYCVPRAIGAGRQWNKSVGTERRALTGR